MQGLHKKQTNTGTLQGYKHEKNNPSNRARLVTVAKKEIAINCGPIECGVFNEDEFKEAMIRVHELRECKCSACLIRDYGDHIMES